MTNNPSAEYDNIVEDIARVCDAEGMSPLDVTKKGYLATGRYGDRALRRHGGFRQIVLAEFGPEEKNASVVRQQARSRAYVAKLERTAGDVEYFTKRVETAIGRAFAANPLTLKKRVLTPPTPTLKQRENVAFISDTHFGLNIDPFEVPSNAYNWQVACRRMGKFASQVATYKIEHRKESPQLRLCLGGDLAQGVIHLSDHGTDLITTQICGTTWILTQMIDYLRNFYSRIVVECTPCNHLRLPHKGPDRALSQKFDSFATLIHTALQLAFRNIPEVSFHIPKTPYTTFEVLDHKFFLTHGDTILETGNVGKTVQIGRITNSVRTLLASDSVDRIDCVMLGHVHKNLYTTLDNGTELIINGTGSGTDSYAQSIGIFSSNPCQVLFEVTKDYVVGDFRKVHLKDAGSDAKYDNIVAPYDGSLSAPPVNDPTVKAAPR